MNNLINKPQAIPLNTKTSTNVPNYSHENFLNSHELTMVKSFFSDVGFQDHKALFTEEILSDTSLMKTLASVAYSWNNFTTFRKIYNSQAKYDCKSNLKSEIKEIDVKCCELVIILKEICNLKPHPSMQALMLSKTYLRKADKIKQFICLLANIQTNVTEKYYH